MVVAGAVALLSASSEATADGLRIRVRGSARIAVHASPSNGEVAIRGTLTDDAGQALGRELLSFRIAREAGPTDPETADGLRHAHACEGDGLPVRIGGPREAPDVDVTTDEGGRFCFMARLPPDRHKGHVTWRGTNLVDAADGDFAFDSSRQALSLRFDPEPRVLYLDALHTVVPVLALIDEGGASRAASGLTLSFANERGQALGTARTDSSGYARFSLVTATAGPPGPGELRVAFTGDADTAFATHATAIERHVQVVLGVPSVERGTLAPAVTEDGVPLIVEVRSSAGPVTEGMVEARIGDTVVGAGPVESGLAKVVVTFASAGDVAQLRLRYVPTSPWFEPQQDLSVVIPTRRPSLLAKAPLLLTGLVMLAFFLVGRVTAKRWSAPKPRRAAESAGPRPEPQAAIEVVEAAPAGEPRWTGRIIDAHDRVPIADVRIWVERGTFDGTEVLADTVSDREGRFRFTIEGPLEVGRSGVRVLAEGRLHGRYAENLPPPGRLSVALLSRKRALLARLVTWARRMGSPFDARPEPTPGHVRRAAGTRSDAGRWAEAVERAVFDRSEVDASVEAEIEQLSARAAQSVVERPAPDGRAAAGGRPEGNEAAKQR